MMARDSILLWMVQSNGHINLPTRPLLRLLGSVLLTFLFFFTVRYITNPLGDGVTRAPVSTAEEFGLGFGPPSSTEPLSPGSIPLEHRISSHERDNGNQGIAAESTIGKVTVLFHGRDPTSIRAIQTHEAHNRRFGYPLLVLRHGLLDGVWTKPATILSALLEELRKAEGVRLQWLM